MAKEAVKKSLVKRILKWTGISFGIVILLIIAAGIAAMIIVDKPFIETQMEKQLHRQVRIGDVSGSLFSAVSGFSVSDVKISNYRTEKAIAALKGKPVAAADTFASMKSFKFRISIPPLLSGKFVLNEIMLYEPVINIVRYKSGAFNFSDLLVTKKLTPAEQAELERKLKEEAEAAKNQPPSKPLKADDIPVAINIGSIGMQDGSVNFNDMTSEQKINLYKVTAKVYDITIDPANLEKNDSIQLKVFTGIKTVSRPKSGSVESFDIGFDITGTVIPFDKKTRLLNPEISLKAGSPYGKMTGLQVFNEMMNVEQLAKYCGKFDFLQKDVHWKNGYVFIHYKDNIATLKDGKIGNDDYAMTFGGKVNVASMNLDLATDMALAKKHTDTVKSRTQKTADKLITGKTRDYLKAEDVADAAVKPMVNDKGEIYLKYTVRGTASKPEVKMVHPQLGSLADIVKSMAKEAAGKVVDKAADAAKDKAKEEAAKKTDKAKDKAGKKIKKLF
ncbi:MAG TPA: AsmA family protein [Spirochaetota bacterium]|nr:AsmA family protein [Spirochaetota bacterium]